MIQVWRIKKLAELLFVTEAEVKEAADNFEQYCQLYLLRSPKNPMKEREVLATDGVLRKIQNALYKRLFARHLKPSAYSHGGIRGRSIKSNAIAHFRGRFIFKADVSDFYPSVSHNRVFRLFRKTFGWPEEVSRVCTRLCTHDFHLALGLVTSPILADQIFTPIDHRISAACEEAGIVYTRFVDDITLSASYSLDPDRCGIPDLIRRILAEHGFKSKPDKELYGSMDDPRMSITGTRIKHGRLTVTREFHRRVSNQIDAARKLAAGQESEADFYPKAHVLGQIRFISWINHDLGNQLVHEYRRVDWRKATAEAVQRELLVLKPRLIPKPKAETSLVHDDIKQTYDAVPCDLAR